MLSVKGGYSWMINRETQNSLKQRYRSNEKVFFKICTSWSHSPVEILLRRNQEYLNQFYLYHTKLIACLLLSQVK